MSRYVLVNNERREVVVGWDPPIGTFFAQEFDKQVAEDQDDLLWWIGFTHREITDLPTLENALRERGWELPPAICTQLANDKAKPWKPGPLQKQLGFTG